MANKPFTKRQKDISKLLREKKHGERDILKTNKLQKNCIGF